MLREVIVTADKGSQLRNLKKTYSWFVDQQRARGLITNEQAAAENDFLNPDIVDKRHAALAAEREKKRAEYMDDEQHERYMKDIFAEGERTDHKGIIPAKDRIKQYKTRLIKRQAPGTAAPGAQPRRELPIFQSQPDFKLMPASAKEVKGPRPVTAAASHLGLSEAPTAASGVGGLSSAVDIGLKARAVSLSRFSKFEEQEKAIRKPLKAVYYTSTEPPALPVPCEPHRQENRFEGRSSYQFYYPTGEMHEQELEQVWLDARNKELADKRRDEEAKQIMKEWSQARGRMEAEIQRRKEHLTVATNFEKSRGWVRSNWKSKNHVPGAETADDFLNLSLTSSDGSPLREGADHSRSIDSPAKTANKQTTLGQSQTTL